MDCKNNTVKHGEVCDKLRIKAEPLSSDEIATESQKLHLQQTETCFMKYSVSNDVDMKVVIKQEVWDPNGVSSDIKCDPFLGKGLKKHDEVDFKEELLYCEETSADSLNETGGSGLKKYMAAKDVPLLESRPYTDPACSSSATQLEENNNSRSLSEKSNKSAQKYETKHSCKICGKTFPNLRRFEVHLLVHDHKRQYKCQICEKRFKYLHVLKTHLLVHDDKRPHKCHLCEKSFKQLRVLKRHLLVHAQKRQHKCQTCEKSFKQLSNLKTHLLVHDDKRQHRCQICEKSFKQWGALKKHLLVHDEKRQYKCQMCEKSFKRSDALKIHLMSHDDKRQYKCQMCDKSFKHLFHLKRHLLIHIKKSNESANFVQNE